MIHSRVLRALFALSISASAVSGSPTSHRYVSKPRDPVWPAALSDQAHGTSWPEFVEKTTRWSTYEAPTFDQVFLPENEEDLSLGLQYLARNDLTWLAKSGGHGYSPTLHSIQNAVLINMENFNYVKIKPDGHAVVGTGTRFGNLSTVVGAAGRELTVGSCPCVGATGAMLGGGLGRLQGLHGLTSDALRKVRLALWNGTIIEASDTVNQDLFWGLRGAGQNFGIVIESTLETWPATNGGLHYNADLTFTKDSVDKIVGIINSLLAGPGLDARLSIITVWAIDPTTFKTVILVNIVYAGPQSQGQKYTNLFKPYSLTLNESVIPWAELPEKSANGFIASACATGKRDNMYGVIARTLDVQAFHELTDAFEKLIQTYPSANGSALLVETFAVQGVEALPDNYSAFPHRRAFHNMVEFTAAYFDDSIAEPLDSFNREWRDRLAQPAISGYDKLHVYQNYAHGDEPLSALYGYQEWRHERLTKLKNQYDPKGHFNGYHAVPYTLSGWT